jgi:hypothetical protein
MLKGRSTGKVLTAWFITGAKQKHLPAMRQNDPLISGRDPKFASYNVWSVMV